VAGDRGARLFPAFDRRSSPLADPDQSRPRTAASPTEINRARSRRCGSTAARRRAELRMRMSGAADLRMPINRRRRMQPIAPLGGDADQSSPPAAGRRIQIKSCASRGWAADPDQPSASRRWAADPDHLHVALLAPCIKNNRRPSPAADAGQTPDSRTCCGCGQFGSAADLGRQTGRLACCSFALLTYQSHPA
jgi:hypothetical protein